MFSTFGYEKKRTEKRKKETGKKRYCFVLDDFNPIFLCFETFSVLGLTRFFEFKDAILPMNFTMLKVS